MVNTGKLNPYGVPVSGLMLDGPVVPLQPPKIFVHTTKYLFVSNALFGPIIVSHQPGFLSFSLWYPAAWASPVSAWITKIAFEPSSLSFPYVSYATVIGPNSTPLSNLIFSSIV